VVEGVDFVFCGFFLNKKIFCVSDFFGKKYT
jgi:hypothetical protein